MIGAIIAKYLLPVTGVLALGLGAFAAIQTGRLHSAQADLEVEKTNHEAALQEISSQSDVVAAAAVAESLRNRVTQLEADKLLSDKVAKAAQARNATDATLLKRLREELKNEASDPESCLGRDLSPATRQRLHEADEAGRRDAGKGSDEVRAGPGTG